MNTNFQAKFLQHLNSKKAENEGFTLIELLVVIIIIGILAAIALPSFLNQAAKARQAEGKNNVGAVNRAQQAFRLENPTFASDFATLAIGIPSQGNNYTFNITTSTGTEAVVTAESGDESIKQYSGGVSIDTQGQTFAISCESQEINQAAPAPAPLAEGEARCPGGVVVGASEAAGG